MKIKLAILDNDSTYVERFTSAFNVKYADSFELYYFSDKDIAMSMLDKDKINVFLSSTSFDIDFDKIPQRCGFAYFIDASDGTSFNGKKAICKFQKAELIYKQILSLYSEHSGPVIEFGGNDSSKVIVFSSPNGGVGTSCMAAACASHFAEMGKNTIYLNLENFGSSDIFFSGEGTFDMSDIIYALKSRNANIGLKFESCVKKDVSGVCFYSEPKIALDMLEMSIEDKIELILDIKKYATYDYIIVDIDFVIDKKAKKLLEEAYGLVWVGDGTDISNTKLQRICTALSIMEQNTSVNVLGKTYLLYNNFSSKTGRSVGDLGIREIGGVPVYSHTDSKTIVNEVKKMNMFDKIL